MPDFLVAAAVKVTADSEREAVDAVHSRVELLDIPGFELLVPEFPKVEIDPDSTEPIRLYTAEEMEAYVIGGGPFAGDDLVTGDLEWLRTHERNGIRLDLYDPHRIGKRGLTLYGYRLSWLYVVEPGHTDNRWEVIFSGEDYEPGPGHDDNDVLADLLGFLASYDELDGAQASARQVQWLIRNRDELSTWSAELEGEC